LANDPAERDSATGAVLRREHVSGRANGNGSAAARPVPAGSGISQPERKPGSNGMRHASPANGNAAAVKPAPCETKPRTAPAPKAAIAIFLVAENRLLRESLAHIFEKRSEFQVLGSSATCLESFEEISRAAPEVLLLGPGAMRPAEPGPFEEFRERLAGSRLVFFGMQEEEETFFAAVRAGAVGYVLKDASSSDLVAAVRAAAQGEATCPPRLCLALFRYVAREAQAMPNFRLRRQFGFTRREQQLLPLLAQGLTNKEIALQLNLSEQTIKNHVHRMMRKAGAADRLAVVEYCRMHNLFA
jgi:DNA-binding NarL/FixJ family response regulator